MSNFRPPEHIFDDDNAVENYIEWRDSEIARRLNDPADEYYPWSPENHEQAMHEFVAGNPVIALAVREKHFNVADLMHSAIVTYWRVVLTGKYDEKSGVMDGQ